MNALDVEQRIRAAYEAFHRRDIDAILSSFDPQDIGARPDAVTRFVRVARRTARSSPTGADRSTLVVPLADKVSELHTVLCEFVRTSVPLTSVLSRPSGAGFGGYSFLLECEGHIDEPSVGSVVAALRRRNGRTVFLGSYPRATLKSSPTREEKP
ncbi:hypothetical protein [Streptomyces sp. MK37H]|uniref:hypothetical protein n=1 Tax=Streptomyces sp. MK37H TaxID=2699117 RepID=UPI001B3786EB|nr:hypothetical protein [Streptomyces sp. MK37H]MBP8538762.1 hypothetical protein [Streptomyces sp. MK37H]